VKIETWLAFCSIALLTAATPGPAVLLVSTNSLIAGFKNSLLTILGNVTGLLFMSTCSVFGLSAVILHSSVLFTTIKILGAFYLAYMGIKLWKKGLLPLALEPHLKKGKTPLNLYIQGLVLALTNPKAIIFTTALFPHFIIVSEPLIPQFALLVISFMTLSFLCLSGYSLLAQRAKKGTAKIGSNKQIGRILGATFIGAGCLLATVRR
jgi:threonine/homoserine/homoserine lactone efflux protein